MLWLRLQKQQRTTGAFQSKRTKTVKNKKFQKKSTQNQKMMKRQRHIANSLNYIPFSYLVMAIKANNEGDVWNAFHTVTRNSFLSTFISVAKLLFLRVYVCNVAIAFTIFFHPSQPVMPYTNI